jgi:hypothetical protein
MNPRNTVKSMLLLLGALILMSCGSRDYDPPLKPGCGLGYIENQCRAAQDLAIRANNLDRALALYRLGCSEQIDASSRSCWTQYAIVGTITGNYTGSARATEEQFSEVARTGLRHCMDDNWISDIGVNQEIVDVMRGLRINCADLGIALERKGRQAEARDAYLVACRRGDVTLESGTTCEAAQRLGGKPDVVLAQQKAAEEQQEIRNIQAAQQEATRQRFEDMAAAREQAAQDRQERQQMIQGAIASIQRAQPVVPPPTNYGSRSTGTTSAYNAPAQQSRTAAVNRPSGPSSAAATGGGASAPNRPASGTGADCIGRNSAVTFTMSRPRGPGHCEREVTGRVTNNSGEELYCRVVFFDGGAPKGDAGAFVLHAGQTVGGEGSGIWSCDADMFRFACFANTPGAGACPVHW